jgi:hypothetical protein
VTKRRWLLIGMGLVILVAFGSVLWVRWTANPVGQWYDRAGNPVPERRFKVWAGDDYCGMGNTIFMALPRTFDPPLPAIGESTRLRHYVWQTGEDDYTSYGLVATPGLVTVMPSDATNTGLHRGRLELWVSPSTLKQEVFVVDGDTIQRWTLTYGSTGCFYG